MGEAGVSCKDNVFFFLDKQTQALVLSLTVFVTKFFFSFRVGKVLLYYHC